jgi:hypothetical protein
MITTTMKEKKKKLAKHHIVNGQERMLLKHTVTGTTGNNQSFDHAS